MANWLSISNLKGSYTSQPFKIPIAADGCISKVKWSVVTPTGSKVIIQTRLSVDGVNWSEWQLCVNEGSIPEVNEGRPFYNKTMMFRVLIETINYDIKPEFKDITFYFEPVIVFENLGDKPCKPEIWITKQGNGDFSITNLSHNNDEFKFTKLLNQETVYVHNERQDIETSLVVTYRYKDFNDNYLSFPRGINILRVTGDADIKFRYQFTLLQ